MFLRARAFIIYEWETEKREAYKIFRSNGKQRKEKHIRFSGAKKIWKT